MKAQRRLLPVFKSAELVAHGENKQVKSPISYYALLLWTAFIWQVRKTVMPSKKGRTFFYLAEKERYQRDVDISRARNIHFR